MKVGEKPAGEIAERKPQDRDHQRDLAPDPIGEPARASAPTNLSHNVTDSTNATSVKGTWEIPVKLAP